MMRLNRETEIAMEVSGAGGLNPKYDAVCKELFLNKEIIAPVLKEVVPEYRNCSIDDVIACIDGSSIVSDPVDNVSAALEYPSSTASINEMPMEMSSVTEKLIRYDARFKALNPRLTTETIRFYLHIDLEVQNDYAPGYPVIKRAIYYAAREISSQLGILTNETNYKALQKTYSIWICNENIPTEIQNTVTSYSFTKSDIIGTTDEPDANFDLMTVIMIRRGNNSGKADIFDYLSGVFSSNVEKVSQYVDVGRSEKIREVFHRMSGLGNSIARENYEKGQQQGEDKVLFLIKKLSDAGRMTDIVRIATDKAYKNQLMKEFAL